MDGNDLTLPGPDEDSFDAQDAPTSGFPQPPRLSSDPDADVLPDRPPGYGEPAEDLDPMPGE